MTVPTRVLTVKCFNPDGTACPDGTRVSAVLDQVDRYQGFIAPRQVNATTTGGIALLSLFPNAPSPTGLGTTGSTYTVTTSWAGSPGICVSFQMPDADSTLDALATGLPLASLTDAQAAIASAQAAAGQAGTSATSAAASASAASTSATNASNSAQAAFNSASNASTSAGSALAASNNASTALASANTAASAASTSATAALTSAGNAATSATNASTSATAAATSATQAAASKTAADTAAALATTNGAAQVTLATAQATSANAAAASVSASASAAATSATNAATSATNAASSASNASTSATQAGTAAGAANTSATSAQSSATSATASAGSATTSANNAATSATSAASSASTATAAANSASTSAGIAQGVASAGQTALAAINAVYSPSNLTAAQQIMLGYATTAQAQASLAASSAASASSVAQQDLSGVSAQALHRSPNPVTALCIYDVSKDSDGGAWVERMGATSWMNEPLNGTWRGPIAGANIAAAETTVRAISGAATGDFFQWSGDGKFYKLNAGTGTTEVFRGNTAKFPKQVGIVAETANVTLYDLTSPGRPMFARFVAAANNMVQGTVSALGAMSAYLCVGSNQGVFVINFAKDSATFQSTATDKTYRGNIAQRGGANAYA